MMVIRSLADFNGAPWAVWSMARHRHRHRPGLHAPARHDEQGVGTFTWPPAGTSSWPPAGTFSWPWTYERASSRPVRRRRPSPTKTLPHRFPRTSLAHASDVRGNLWGSVFVGDG